MKKQSSFFSLLIFLIFTVLIKCIFQLVENNFILYEAVEYNNEKLISDIIKILALIGLIVFILKKRKTNRYRY